MVSIPGTIVVLVWLGWLTPPGVASERSLEAWRTAHAIATANIEAQGRSIVVLQERELRAKSDVEKLTEEVRNLARIVYRMDQRTQ